MRKIVFNRFEWLFSLKIFLAQILSMFQFKHLYWLKMDTWLERANHFYRNGSKPSAALYGLWRYSCFTGNTNWLLNFTGLVATISLAMALRYGFRLVGLTSGYKHKWNRKQSGSLQPRFSSSEIAAFSFFNSQRNKYFVISLLCLLLLLLLWPNQSAFIS